ncbi:MAG TPA: hypothetical protein VJ717_04215 [Gemmatimonadaceae bacterium]|nr:hypothetical protein [Gemmatimonadaceae bacterium]
MSTNRREFIGHAAGAALFGVLPLSLEAAPTVMNTDDWDISWPKRLTGKHKAVFDVPEVESGYGVWRASIWAQQYRDVLKVAPNDLSQIIILRHNGIVLGMQQSFWDKYKVGETKKVTHPVTSQVTDRNPVLLSSERNEVPARLDAYALDRFIARGGIVLACNLAFQDCVDTIEKQDSVSADEARTRAKALLIPGVILQPSGVFAAVLAQEAGASYVRAS